jgi:AmmeMemoRadiSam system protein A
MSEQLFHSDDRRLLLAIARQAIEARVRRGAEPAPRGGGALDTLCGAFVSIHRSDTLRGCLGRLEADWPIARVVSHLGGAVADSDPRFAPVTEEELDHLTIEISALSAGRGIRSIAEIEIGRHGLIVERGSRRGLLLPQVATERAWDVETFLSHTCIKAMLPPNAWKHDARVLIFEAEVFGAAAGPVERIG